MEYITVSAVAHDGSGMPQCVRMLRQDQGITVLRDAADGEDLLVSMRRLQPRVLLMGVDLCGDEACAVLQSLRRDCPATRVLLVTRRAIADQELARALVDGAHGYLDLADLERLLAPAVHGLGRGEAWVPRKMLGKIMEMALP